MKTMLPLETEYWLFGLERDTITSQLMTRRQIRFQYHKISTMTIILKDIGTIYTILTPLRIHQEQLDLPNLVIYQNHLLEELNS